LPTTHPLLCENNSRSCIPNKHSDGLDQLALQHVTFGLFLVTQMKEAVPLYDRSVELPSSKMLRQTLRELFERNLKTVMPRSAFCSPCHAYTMHTHFNIFPRHIHSSSLRLSFRSQFWSESEALLNRAVVDHFSHHHQPGEFLDCQIPETKTLRGTGKCSTCCHE